jgi:hypothetical protein
MTMIRRVLFAVVAALLIGCSGSNAIATPKAPPVPTPSPTPTVAPQHLYVANGNSAGQIVQFTLPLSASSTPNFGITSPNATTVAVGPAGDLIAGDATGHLTYFVAPLSAASGPAATFVNGSAGAAGQIAMTTSGDIFVPTLGNAVNVFTHPFSNSSTPSATITSPQLTAMAVAAAFDSAANLYVSEPGLPSYIYVYAPPYTGAPTNSPGVAVEPYRELTADSTHLFVNVFGGGPGHVDVFNLPITASSTPSFVIASGVNNPGGIALDGAGNLYVGNYGNSTISVYTPPFSSASAPSLSFKVTGTSGLGSIFIGM